MPEATGMVAVMKYMGIAPNVFRGEWAMLSEADKTDLKTGIGTFNPETNQASGPLTY
jgi:hypothetical protein